MLAAGAARRLDERETMQSGKQAVEMEARNMRQQHELKWCGSAPWSEAAAQCQCQCQCSAVQCSGRQGTSSLAGDQGLLLLRALAYLPSVQRR